MGDDSQRGKKSGNTLRQRLSQTANAVGKRLRRLTETPTQRAQRQQRDSDQRRQSRQLRREGRFDAIAQEERVTSAQLRTLEIPPNVPSLQPVVDEPREVVEVPADEMTSLLASTVIESRVQSVDEGAEDASIETVPEVPAVVMPTVPSNPIAIAIRESSQMQALNLMEAQQFMLEGGDPHQGGTLGVNEIDAYLRYLHHLQADERFAFVRPVYSYLPHAPGWYREEGRARAFDYVIGDVDTAEWVLLPRITFLGAVQANADRDIGHFTMGLYRPASGVVFHFDSLRVNDDFEAAKRFYKEVVATLRPMDSVLPPFRYLRTQWRPSDTYNVQRDGVNCGFYAALYAELILRNGHLRTYAPQLDIDLRGDAARAELQNQRRRIFNVLEQIVEGRLPATYSPPPAGTERRPPLPTLRLSRIRNTTSNIQSAEQLGQSSQRVEIADSGCAQSLRATVQREQSGPTTRFVEVDDRGRAQIVSHPPSLRPIQPNRSCERTHAGRGCYANSGSHVMGKFTPSGWTGKQCSHCDAWLSDHEATRRDRLRCRGCNDGRIATAEMRAVFDSYQRGMLETVREWTRPGNPHFNHFRKESANYNGLLKFGHHNCQQSFVTGGGPAVGTLNGDLNITMSDIFPVDGSRPRLGHYYTLDSQAAMEARQSEHDLIQRVNEPMLQAMEAEIRRRNWLARGYENSASFLRQYLDENGLPPAYRVIIANRERGQVVDSEGNRLPNPTDVPMSDQPFLVWADADGTGEPPDEPGVWLYNRGSFVELGKWDPLSWPALFTSIFGDGQLGFRSGMSTTRAQEPQPSTNDNDLASNAEDPPVQRPVVGRGKFISMQEFLRYILYRRPTDLINDTSFVNSLHFVYDTGRAGLNFVMVANHQVKAREAEAYRRHQDEINLRSMLSRDYVEMLEKGMPEEARLGRYYYKPDTIPGSRRYYQQKYTDLLAIKEEMGRNPDFFITVTMDIGHNKVLEQLRPGEQPVDRPDVVMRVWEEIYYKIIDDVSKKGRFGKCDAFAIVREHQGRGAPHAHLVVWTADCPGKGTPEWIDDYISAEIPDLPPSGAVGEGAEQQKRLHDLVSRLMLHDHTARCQREDGGCSKFFPKQYTDCTHLNVHRFPQYRRRVPYDETAVASDEVAETGYRRRPPLPAGARELTPEEQNFYGNKVYRMRGRAEKEYDNSAVVPYNPAMLLEYEMHCNVEYVGSSGVFHYLCEYICKGKPLLTARVERLPDGTEQMVQDYDEFAYEAQVTYDTPTSAMADVLDIPYFRLSHVVHHLYITMPDGNRIVCEEDDPEGTARPVKNTLQAYFDLNRELAAAGDHSADLHTYATINKDFYFKAKKWHRRLRGRMENEITCIGRVAERNSEGHALRILLLHTNAPKSYNDLKRLPTDPLDLAENSPILAARSFQEAAQARGLLESADIWVRTFREAFHEIHSSRGRARYFAVVTYNAGVEGTSEEILRRILDDMFPPPVDSDPATSQPARLQQALNCIQYNLEKNFNSSCEEIGLRPPCLYSQRVEENLEHREAQQALHPEGHTGSSPGAAVGASYWLRIRDSNIARMIESQRDVYFRTMDAIRRVCANPFDMDARRYCMFEGPGGVGKTLLNETIIAACHVENLGVIATATTGMAANLLRGGATLHSTLFIPPDVDARTVPRLEAHTQRAERLRNCKLLIIDEVSMLHGDVFEYVDRQLRDLFTGERAQLPFGGIPILLTGNWAQLLPIVEHATHPAAQRQASIKTRPLFQQNFHTYHLRENMRLRPGEREFAEWLMDVAEGRNIINDQNHVLIPPGCRANSQEELINFCFPPEVLANPLQHTKELAKSCILAPHRVTSAEINQAINDRLPGDYVTLEGFDYLVRGGYRPSMYDIHTAEADVEHLHGRQPSGFPPHKLKLKLGSVCIMNCNYDPGVGLFNGTRVQVVGFLQDNIKVKILDSRGSPTDQTLLIGRKKFEYGRKRGEYSVPFTRTQFPLECGAALTCTKGQGQSFDKVGVDLFRSQVFAKHMAYTAVSRVTSKSGLKIWSSLSDRFVNLVDYELLGIQPPRRVSQIDTAQNASLTVPALDPPAPLTEMMEQITCDSFIAPAAVENTGMCTSAPEITAPSETPGPSITVYGAPLAEAEMAAIVEWASSPIQGNPVNTEELRPDMDMITEEEMLYEPTEMTLTAEEREQLQQYLADLDSLIVGREGETIEDTHTRDGTQRESQQMEEELDVLAEQEDDTAEPSQPRVETRPEPFSAEQLQQMAEEYDRILRELGTEYNQDLEEDEDLDEDMA